MNEFRHPPAPPGPTSEATRLRGRALWTGLALAPATLLVVILMLATEQGTACVMVGPCGDVPGPVYLATLAVAGVAWIWALTTPEPRPSAADARSADADDAAPVSPAPHRKAAYRTLVGAEVFFLFLLVVHFAG
ncbi:hypothetical protein [Streptomyces roseicoloratus]|uniref:hypothetical protein n=1 Tax=Streptomyces roseicoloratus TaxID=2508722 RepID=UPI001009D140|nr:hypothetical protein [Streptomyces roseicoloratus]